MRMYGYEVLCGCYVVVHDKEETVYILETRMVVRLLLYKIVDLKWLQLLWWQLILSTFGWLYYILVIDYRV